MEKLHAIITIKKKGEKKKIEIIKRTNRTKHKGFTDSIHYRRLSTYKRNEKKKKKTNTKISTKILSHKRPINLK